MGFFFLSGIRSWTQDPTLAKQVPCRQAVLLAPCFGDLRAWLIFPTFTAVALCYLPALSPVPGASQGAGGETGDRAALEPVSCPELPVSEDCNCSLPWVGDTFCWLHLTSCQSTESWTATILWIFRMKRRHECGQMTFLENSDSLWKSDRTWVSVCFKELWAGLGVGPQAYNPNTQWAEASGLLWVQGQFEGT